MPHNHKFTYEESAKGAEVSRLKRKFPHVFTHEEQIRANKASHANGASTRYLLEDVFAGKHPQYPAGCLRNSLIKSGLKKDEYERCHVVPGIGTYRCVEPHHKNGDGHDHRLENIEFLCPNCHSLTPNWKNCNKHRSTRVERLKHSKPA